MGAIFVFYMSITKCLSDIRMRLLISPKHHCENPCKDHEEAPLVTLKINNYPRSWNVRSSTCGVM